MAMSRKSSRNPACASSASARPKSASSERSWNSSKITAATPASEGSSRMRRVNTPSVTTSRRVSRETREPSRMRKPTVPPTSSPRSIAMREAAARAASRRGSRRRRRRPCVHGSSRSAKGTRVVLPAPVGATITALGRPRNAARISGRRSSIGSGVSSTSRMAIGSGVATGRFAASLPCRVGTRAFRPSLKAWIPSFPRIPGKAGTPGLQRKSEKCWVPASAGTSGGK